MISTGREHCYPGHCLLNYECVSSKNVFANYFLEQRFFFQHRNHMKGVFWFPRQIQNSVFYSWCHETLCLQIILWNKYLISNTGITWRVFLVPKANPNSVSYSWCHETITQYYWYYYVTKKTKSLFSRPTFLCQLQLF